MFYNTWVPRSRCKLTWLARPVEREVFRSLFVCHKIRARVLDLLQQLPFFFVLSNEEIHAVVLLEQCLNFVWDVAVFGRHVVVPFPDGRLGD